MAQADRVQHIRITPPGFRYRWQYERPRDPRPTGNLPPALSGNYPNGELQSCVASAVAGAIQYCRKKQGETDTAFLPSVLYIYYWARYLEGREGQDHGANTNSALRACLSYGFCSEDEWKYDVDNVFVRPTSAMASASKCAVASFKSIRRDEKDLKSCISVTGLPFICTLNINAEQYFAADPNSEIQFGPNPDASHCVLCVAYDERTFTVLDSMGRPHAPNSPRSITCADMLDGTKVSDFWMIDRVLGPDEKDTVELDKLRGGHLNYALEFQSMLAAAYDREHPGQNLF